MKTKKVFDSFALIAYLNQEDGYAAVKDFLREIKEVVHPLVGGYNIW